jgi:hypothetical protein
MDSRHVVAFDALAMAALLGGCGPSHKSEARGTDGGSLAQPAADAGGGFGANGRTPSACQGFNLVGLKYSPGGHVLPNTCAPFDAATNNPYAIRCIDAMPQFKTPFPGDDLCILPPPPDQGVQVGLHPQGKDYWAQIWAGDYSGYQNPDAIWLLTPGAEVTQNYLGNVDTPDAHDYYREYFRMRTGTHHNIITLNKNANGVQDGWIPLSPGQEASPAIFNSSVGSLLGIIGGSQRPIDQNPSTLEKPPEDMGYYLKWPANPAVVFNIHHINAGSAPLLREAWVNIWWESDASLLESWFMGLDPTEPRSLSVAPGAVVDLHYSWTIPAGSPIRLIRAFGHRHFWDTNLSVWIERSGSTTPEVVYQSFDWANMPTYTYNGEIANPVPDPVAHGDGAASGLVTLNPGDKLHFNCHLEYTDRRAATNASAPIPESNGPLKFANETFKAEMCLIYGNSTGQLVFPAADTSPLPGFATQ